MITTGAEIIDRKDESNMDDLDSYHTVTVVCHDGTKVTTNRHIQYLHAFLAFNREFDVPLYVSQVLDKDYIATPSGHVKLMEHCMDVVHKHHNGAINKTKIAPIWSKCNDLLIEACIADIEHFSATIDAEDIMQIISDPYIIKIRSEMKAILASEQGPDIKSNAIINCNSLLIDYIREYGFDKWPMNGVVQHIKAESIKLDQLCQLCNVVGYMTEIDSEIYPMPSAESFSEGMNYPYTYATNSSLGKKSTIYNKSPISDTETLNRLMQQMTSQVESIERGDCGSTRTGRVLVSNSIKKSIEGMYHLPEDGSGPELLTPDVVEKYLGKMIDLRNVSGCDSKSPVGFCEVCGGASMRNFVEDYNVGGASACYVFGKNSQLILKTKHVDIINFETEGSLSIELREFLSLSTNGKDIYAKDNCKNADISFLATRKRGIDKTTNGQFLQTIFSVKSLDGAELTSFGEVEALTLVTNSGLGEVISDVKIKQGSVANFSLDLLTFLRENPKNLTMHQTNGNKTSYNISLTGFDISKPIFNMPFKNFDSLSLHNQLKTFFLSPDNKIHGEVLTDYESFTEALVALSKMIHPKLGTPMSILQIILLPFTVADPSVGDYRIPFGGDHCKFGKLGTIRRHRSLSVVTIATHQSSVFGHLSPLIRDNMLPHTYDGQYV